MAIARITPLSTILLAAAPALAVTLPPGGSVPAIPTGALPAGAVQLAQQTYFFPDGAVTSHIQETVYAENTGTLDFQFNYLSAGYNAGLPGDFQVAGYTGSAVDMSNLPVEVLPSDNGGFYQFAARSADGQIVSISNVNIVYSSNPSHRPADTLDPVLLRTDATAYDAAGFGTVYTLGTDTPGPAAHPLTGLLEPATGTTPPPVPEPSVLILLPTALAALATRRRVRSRHL